MAAGARTDHVMVPVPEEVLEEVERFVARQKTQANLPKADPHLVRESIRHFDDRTRRLVDIVVDAARSSRNRTIADIAAELGLTPRETLGTMVELNYSLPKLAGPIIGLWLGPAAQDPASMSRPFVERMAMFPGDQLRRAMDPEAFGDTGNDGNGSDDSDGSDDGTGEGAS